ncbi:ABC transporter substrate-binding protein [Rhodothermaceae bacterium RA]|nr:ABC transporter substrate-binding protein [Rhodothermaceae bacterium RA]
MWAGRAAVLLLALALAACGRGDAGGPATAEGPIRLTYWSSQNPQERELARRLVEAWNAQNPDVQVTVQPIPAGQSSEEVLLAAVVAGTTPDLCSNIWPGIVSEFVRAGGVLRLDTLAGFDSLMQSRVPPALMEQFQTPEGHVYQIPWKSNPILMQYNVGLFREAGFETPPRTYTEFLEAAAKITKDLDGDGRYDRWIGYRDIQPIWHQRYFDFYAFYIAASGGRTLFEDGRLQLDTLASNRVFGFFQQLYRHGYFPKSKFQGNPFVAEKTATEFVGPWNIAWLEENAPQGLVFDYAPLPVPDGYDGPRYTYGDYKNIAIFSSTKHPEAAWRFAKYLVSRQADLLLLEIATQIPIRRDLLTDSTFVAFFERNPRLVPFAEQVPATRGIEEVEGLPEILDAIARPFEAAAVYDAYPPEEATRRAAERIRVILEWNS